ncbi:MAG: hypothetical protein U5R46_00850 [Gammaproteobacteria bacterium]|nr:hypothetical protein [Gammaproteobacteria bacterium]
MLWGVSCYFNPSGYHQPLENLQAFSDGVRGQGLHLAIVELAIGAGPFVVDASLCDRLIQLRTDEVLWHKEALLNIGIEQLPDDCSGVCWLDADILFDNKAWVAETVAALDNFPVVQPFSHCTWLPPGVRSVPESLTVYPAMHDEFNRIHSFGFGWRNFGKHALEERILYGHVGFAWAARRELVQAIRLYDGDIYAGSGDNFMAHAFVGHDAMLRVDGELYSAAMIRHFRQWSSSAYQRVQGEVGYVDGNVNHLWHGTSANRRYLERLMLLRDSGFDPARHLIRCDNGLYELVNAPDSLSIAVREYFDSRLEDSPPDNAGICVFGPGFYDDEGDFRWSQQVSEMQIARDCDDWSFAISNNILKSRGVKQRIDISRNGEDFKTLYLESNRKVTVEVGKVFTGDRFQFNSDFGFRPSDSGAADHRNLSFMFW